MKKHIRLTEKREHLFSKYNCSLCSLLQADEGRREEAHSTPGEERAGSLLSAHGGTARALPRISGLQVDYSSCHGFQIWSKTSDLEHVN